MSHGERETALKNAIRELLKGLEKRRDRDAQGRSQTQVIYITEVEEMLTTLLDHQHKP